MGSCTSTPVQLRQGADDPNRERVNRYYRWTALAKQTRRRILKRKVHNRKGAIAQLKQWQGQQQQKTQEYIEEEESDWDMPDNGYHTPASLVVDPKWDEIDKDLIILGEGKAHVGPLPDELEFEKNLRPTRRVIKKKVPVDPS